MVIIFPSTSEAGLAYFVPSGYETGRHWLKILEGFQRLLHVSDREIHTKQLLAISSHEPTNLDENTEYHNS